MGRGFSFLANQRTYSYRRLGSGVPASLSTIRSRASLPLLGAIEVFSRIDVAR